MRLAVLINGVTEASERLDGIAKRARDQRPVLNVIADDWRDAERRWFESQGGGSWPPDRPSTIANKRRAGLNVGVLRAKDVLFRSLTEKRAKYSRSAVRSDELRFGTRAGIAVLTNQGVAHRKRGGQLPARPVLSTDLTRTAGEQLRIGRYILTGSL